MITNINFPIIISGFHNYSTCDDVQIPKKWISYSCNTTNPLQNLSLDFGSFN